MLAACAARWESPLPGPSRLWVRAARGGLLDDRAQGTAGEESLEAVLERAALGDREAFARLWQRFAADVLRLCRRMLDSDAEAEDARSESFLRAWQSFAGYDRARPFRSWLLSVAAHRCVDRLRRRAGEGRIFDSAELDAAQLPSGAPGPLSAALLQEQGGRLQAALAAQPARFRAVLALRYFAEMRYAEIAAALGIAPEQVGVLLFRAKARLRAALSQELRP